jgi:hypothetical protein
MAAVELPMQKMTVPELRDELKKQNLPMSGRKIELIARLSSKSFIESPTPNIEASLSSMTKKRGVENDKSPSKRASSKSLFIQNLDEEESTEEKYVPAALFAHLDYKMKGEQALTPAEASIYAFVERECNLPDDFDTHRSFGPLSGTFHEERAIFSYIHGQFKHQSDLATRFRNGIKKLVIESRHEEAALVLANAT